MYYRGIRGSSERSRQRWWGHRSNQIENWQRLFHLLDNERTLITVVLLWISSPFSHNILVFVRPKEWWKPLINASVFDVWTILKVIPLLSKAASIVLWDDKSQVDKQEGSK